MSDGLLRVYLEACAVDVAHPEDDCIARASGVLISSPIVQPAKNGTPRPRAAAVMAPARRGRCPAASPPGRQRHPEGYGREPRSAYGESTDLVEPLIDLVGG